MLLTTRRYGSQRTSKPLPIELTPNFSGQGGYDFISFFSAQTNKFYSIIPETEEECCQLMAQTLILFRNFGEK